MCVCVYCFLLAQHVGVCFSCATLRSVRREREEERRKKERMKGGRKGGWEGARKGGREGGREGGRTAVPPLSLLILFLCSSPPQVVTKSLTGNIKTHSEEVLM